MNLLHVLSEPNWLELMLMFGCFVLSVMLVYFVLAGHKPTRTDPLKDAIDRCDEHCRIKADYDCNG